MSRTGDNSGHHKSNGVNLTHLRWLTVLVPGLALAAFDYARHRFMPGYLHVWPGTIFMTVAVFLGTYLVSYLLFHAFERRKQTLVNMAVLEERDRIAREMHDSLAQVLGYLHLKSRQCQGLLASGQNEVAQRELQEMAQSAKAAYDDVREAILGLRGSVAPGLGLAGSLQEYLQTFSRQTGVNARLVVEDGAAARFPPTWEVQLIRVIQEALANVRKHARASTVVVRVETEAVGARIAVEDNGRGFDPAAQLGEGHFGLQTMKERVESIGGSFRVESRPGQGTRVLVHLREEPVGAL